MTDADATPAVAAGDVLDRVDDGVLGLDDEWRVSYANDRAAALLDADAATIDDRPLWSAVPAVAASALEMACRDAADRGERVGRYVSLPGATGPIHATVHPGEGGVTLQFDASPLDPENWAADSLVQRVFDTGPLSVGVLDESGTFVGANDRAGDRLGFDADRPEYEVGDRDVYDESGDYVPPAERPYVALFEEGGEVSGWECQIDVADGSRRWISIDAAPLDDTDDVAWVLVVATDITQQKRQERRLQRERDELRTELSDVFERVTDAFFALDAEWRFTYVNDRAANLVGGDEGELLGETVWDVFPGAVDTEFERQYRRAMETQEPASFEAYFDPLETWFRVHAYPSETGLSVHYRDVTGVKRRERALERYQTVVEAVEDGVYVVDEDGRFVMVNERYAEMTGRSRDSLVGSHVTSVVDEETAAEAADLEADLLAGDDERRTVVTTIDTPEGTIAAEATFALVETHDGDYHRAAVVRDVTERRERERRLEEQRADLERLVAISSVAQRISQEALAADTAEAVSSLVVERLADVPYYEVAWIGTETDGELTYRTGAGADEETLSGLVSAATDGPEANPAQTALRRGSVQVRQNVPDHSHDARRRLFEEAGIASTISLPISDGATTRGVLTVDTAREHAFSGTERDVLAGMADTVGVALETVEHRQRYRSLVDDVLDTAAEVGISVLDGSGTVVWLNDAIETYFGVDRGDIVGATGEEMAGTPLRDAVADPDDVVAQLLAAHDRETPRRRTELHVTAGADREERHLEHRAVPVRDGLYAGGWVDIFTDVTERRASEEALAERETRYRSIVQAVTDYAIFMLDPDGTVATWNEGAERIKGYDADEIVGESFTRFYTDAEREARVPERNLATAAREGRVEREGWRVRADGSEFWALVVITALYDDDGTLRGFSKVTRDMTERRERERDLQRLSELNDVIRRLDQALVSATTHEEVEELVCERLVEWTPYVFAWYGEVALGGEGGVEVTAHAGREEGYLSELEVTFGDGPTARGPTGRAIARDEVTVTEDIETADDFGPWREAALERGYRSSVAVPVQYGDTRYGIIGLYADQTDPLSSEERSVIAELGETIGHAKNALRRKESLVSDTVVQLDLSFDLSFDPADVLSEASRDADANLAVEDTVVTAEGTLLHYVTADGFSATSIEHFVESAPTFTGFRRVSEDDDVYELHQRESGLVDLLASHGGRVREFSIGVERSHVVVELPQSVAVREFIDTVQAAYPDVSLDAQRTVEREAPSDWELRDAVTDDLTEKQRTALEVAYHAGYFAWPRESDGEVVADTLDVSPSTFHQHLRAGERKLFAVLFDE